MKKLNNYVGNPFQSPVILSFCPGILGLERGLAKAIGKFNIAAYVEIESFIIENLVAGMEAGILDPTPIWTDAKTFDAWPFRGKIQGIIGGYPCPGESLAGLREKHLYKGFLWPAIRKAIAATKPLWCFFENVDDHLTGTFPIVLRSLHLMGYRVEAGVFSAEEVGATHERQRLFILAILEHASNFQGWQDCKTKLEMEGYILRKTRWYKSADGSGTTGSTSGELEYTDGEQVHQSGHGLRNKSYRADKELADADECGDQAGRDNAGRQTRADIDRGSEGAELADTDQQRRQLPAGREFPAVNESFSHSSQGGIAQWPAGQGNFQYPFEEPRTIEPRLGCTANGYNFREDLLRAIGNSVVEQTAELAFNILLLKHLSNYR